MFRLQHEVQSHGSFSVTKFIDPVLEFLNNLWGLEPSRIGLSYRPSKLHRLAESIPWNRFLGSRKVKKYRLCTGVET
jgi:hypothetical protein